MKPSIVWTPGGLSADAVVSDNSAGAIFASHSLATIGAIRALREAGLSDSVALVEFDDFELADLVEPGVTVIAQDPERISRIAAERLFARIDGPLEEARKYVVPTRLVARGSGELRAG